MPLLRKGVLLPSKGVNFAIPSTFIEDQQTFSENMRYDRGVLRRRQGKTTLGAALASANQIMGYGLLQLSSGTQHVVRASKGLIQRLNVSTQAWETISIISYTSDDEDFFAFANVTEDNLLISTNYKNAMYKWPGSGNQVILGGSPPKAKYLAYVTPYLLAAYTDDGMSVKPWGVSWCDTNNPEVWTGGNSGQALITDEPSPIQNIAKLSEFVAVYKKDSLAVGIKVDPPDIFRFETIKTGIGLAAPRAFADAEGIHYFMSNNDFMSWNGIRTESIGAAVREHIFSRVNKAKINRCFAIHVQEQTEIWFFILTSSDSWPTEVWKYNYRFGFWYFDSCRQVTAGIRWKNISSLTWDQLQGSWDQQQTSWDGFATGIGTEEIMLGHSDGYSSKLDYTVTDDQGVAVDARFISKDFAADSYELGARWLKLDLWAKGPGKLYVDYSDDQGSNWTNIPFQSSQAYADLTGMMTKYEWYFDIWATTVRFRFRNSESNETFYLQQFFPYYLNREEAVTHRA